MHGKPTREKTENKYPYYKVYDHVKMVPLPRQARNFLVNLEDQLAWEAPANEGYVALYSQQYAMYQLANRIQACLRRNDGDPVEQVIKPGCSYELKEEMREAFPWPYKKLFHDSTWLVNAHVNARKLWGWDTPGHVVPEDERRKNLDRMRHDFEIAAEDYERFRDHYQDNLTQWSLDYLDGIINIGKSRAQALETALMQPVAEPPSLCRLDMNQETRLAFRNGAFTRVAAIPWHKGYESHGRAISMAPKDSARE